MKIATINISSSNGKQVIDIPDDMRINDDKIYLKQVGNTLHLIPFHHAWDSLTDSVNLFTPDFMNERQQPPIQPRELFD